MNRPATPALPVSRHRHPLRILFAVHRISGLAMVLFLPFHFFVLGLALHQDSLDGFLKWSDLLPTKIVEFGLVFLFAVHFLGGCRLLALEFLGLFTSPNPLKLAGGLTILGALIIATIFLVRALL